MSDKNNVILGKFASVYGVKGWIKVISYTDPIENILNYSHWQVHLQGKWQSVTLEHGKRHGKFLIVKLTGDDDRDRVRRFTNHNIYVRRDDLPQLEHNQHYIQDLIGLRITNLNNETLGHITDIQSTPANDIIVVTDKNNKLHLIPYLDHVVKKIDTDTGDMQIDWDLDWESHDN